MLLTDTAIRKAKPAAGLVKLSDGGGLQLHLHPNGAKYWKLAYRYDGKQKKLAFGVYPEVSLAEARKRREAARALLRDGKDPMVERRVEKLARAIAAGNTFAAIADELLAKMTREGRAETTLKKTRWLFDFARPLIGDRPIAEISAAEVLAVLRKVEVRGRHETARRLRSTIGSVFRYAIGRSMKIIGRGFGTAYVPENVCWRALSIGWRSNQAKRGPYLSSTLPRSKAAASLIDLLCVWLVRVRSSISSAPRAETIFALTTWRPCRAA